MNATYFSFLETVIDEGIKAAKADYTEPEDKDRLKGSIEGFDACRGKSPVELWELLTEAQKKTVEAHLNESIDYWRVRCREAEIEWVCNVVSAALANSGLTPLVPPTARGVLQAARILAGGALLTTDEVPA